jgi:hypothetical protein
MVLPLDRQTALADTEQVVNNQSYFMKRKKSKKPRTRKLTLSTRVDRRQVVVERLIATTPDIHYWLTRTPTERMQAMQLLREINYGPAASGRLRRVLEVVTR